MAMTPMMGLCPQLRRRHVYAAEMPAYQALSTDDFRQPSIWSAGLIAGLGKLATQIGSICAP